MDVVSNRTLELGPSTTHVGRGPPMTAACGPCLEESHPRQPKEHNPLLGLQNISEIGTVAGGPPAAPQLEQIGFPHLWPTQSFAFLMPAG